MGIDRCRVCGAQFFEPVLLKLGNMPMGAQQLPDDNSVKDDKGVSLDVWQCSACGLVQLSNAPVPYYREVIRAAAFSQSMQEFRKKQFLEFAEKFGLRETNVIEIGCGKGEYLSLIKESGMNAFGLEFGEESVFECLRRGMQVQQGFVDELSMPLYGAPFQAFFILNFLEHLPDPNKTLSGIRKNLSEDAVGLVEVPNFDMIVKKKLFSEFIGDHLFYFTKETLNSTLARAGFEILECKEIWYDYILSAEIRNGGGFLNQEIRSKKFQRLNISDFYQVMEKVKKDLHDYIDAFDRVAVWGAGHQALAVMALADLGKKICYVVDSASFKQGRYTPATHIPIVAPEYLKTEPVDAVIICLLYTSPSPRDS